MPVTRLFARLVAAVRSPPRASWPFLGAVVLLVGFGALTIDMLAGARAFVGGESLWSKSQKEASGALALYARTADPAQFVRYQALISVPLGDRRARLELDRATPDLEVVRRGFIDGGVHPDDIAAMIRLYRRFGSVSFMARAIDLWRQGDEGIDALAAVADELHRRIVADDPDLAARDALARRAEAIDRELAPLEQAFAETLGEASRRTESILQLTMLSLAGLLAIAGIWLARHLAQRAGTAEAARQLSDERLLLAGSGSNDGLWDWDLRTETIYFSPRVAELLGCEAAALAPDGSAFLQRVHPDDRAMARQALLAHLRDRERYEVEFRLLHGDGAYRWFLARGQSVRAADGRATRMAGSLKNITDRKRDEAAIKRQAMQQGLIAAFGQLALTNPDADELMRRAVGVVGEGLGAEFCRLLATTGDAQVLVQQAASGWDAAWAGHPSCDAAIETGGASVGAREAVVIDDFERETRFEPSAVLLAHRVRSAAELPICGAHGSYGVLGIYARAPGRFNQESVNFLHGVTNTIASALDRKVAEERLTYMAQFDPLTSLPNRSMYLDRLWQTINQASRDQLPVGVLFVDLDRFKIVNDTLGHSAGDELLLQVAQRLQGCIRPGDTVGRLGGDEFALALAHLAKAEDAGGVAHKIVEALAAPFELDGQQVYVSASIGISICPADGTEPDQLLKNADTAMYRAKEAGRNNHQFFRAEMNERSVQRLKLETQLRGALDRGEFLLHYQPKVDLASGQISGFEALLRWQHPERGLVPPGHFVTILEETGLVIPVGEWVVDQVCRQLAAWRAAGLPMRPVAVNLSARQFGQRDLDARVGAIMRRHAIGPGLLEFELTESMLMHDPEAAVQVMRRIKSYGIRLAVDDFGTGYSSLAYLKRFPLDALKIDRAFIRDVTNDPDDATIAIAIINLARSLNLDVVAEGVETAAQLDFLRANGCTEMQGYFFARPMPADGATQAVEEGWCLPGPGAPLRRAAGAYA